jgi:GxxExxY protein
MSADLKYQNRTVSGRFLPLSRHIQAGAAKVEGNREHLAADFADDAERFKVHLRCLRYLRRMPSEVLMNWDPVEYKHQELTQAIIRAFYEVYNELGHGFLESVYEEAMAIALTQSGMQVNRQHPLPVWLRGRQVGDFRADLVVADAVIVELKAARALEPAHEAQLLNYLRASPIEVGLLLNFGQAPKVKRMVFGNEKKLHLRLSA